MRKPAVATILIGLTVASAPGPLHGQQFEYTKQAEFDEKGSIFVSSEQGKLMWMGDTKHCSEARVANDQQTVGCRAMQGELASSTGQEPSADTRRVCSLVCSPQRRANEVDWESLEANQCD